MSRGSDPKGYYARLGIKSSASAEDIKRAYRHLAKELHPDRNNDASAKSRFQAANEAYSVLSEPGLQKRV